MAPPSNVSYALPWQKVSPEVAAGLLHELLLELGDGAAWIRQPLQALARRVDNDDVLFQNGTEYAVVHLTYSGKKERPGFPFVLHFDDWQTLDEEILTPDTLEYQAGESE